MAVPATADTTASATCTSRKLVAPWWKERGSFQMLRMNVGQMIHVHTPKASKNSAADRESLIMAPLCPAGHGQRAAGTGQRASALPPAMAVVPHEVARAAKRLRCTDG